MFELERWDMHESDYFSQLVDYHHFQFQFFHFYYTILFTRTYCMTRKFCGCKILGSKVNVKLWLDVLILWFVYFQQDFCDFFLMYIVASNFAHVSVIIWDGQEEEKKEWETEEAFVETPWRLLPWTRRRWSSEKFDWNWTNRLYFWVTVIHVFQGLNEYNLARVLNML